MDLGTRVPQDKWGNTTQTYHVLYEPELHSHSLDSRGRQMQEFCLPEWSLQ